MYWTLLATHYNLGVHRDQEATPVCCDIIQTGVLYTCDSSHWTIGWQKKVDPYKFKASLVYIEFSDFQGYIPRPCLKKLKKKKRIMEALSVLGRLWFPVYKNQVVKIISVFLKLNFTNF